MYYSDHLFLDSVKQPKFGEGYQYNKHTLCVYNTEPCC